MCVCTKFVVLGRSWMSIS